MTTHLGGFAESIDAAGVAANLAALADDRLFTQGDDLRVPSLNQVTMIAGGVSQTTTIGARLTSPTLDARNRLVVEPVSGGNDGDVEPASPIPALDFRTNPLALGVDEILQVTVDSNTSAVALQWVLLWFSDGPIQPVTGGNMFTARLTGTTTVVVDVWSSVNLTLTDNLQPGRYQIVGMRARSTTGVACRLVNREGGFWRDGCIATDDAQNIGEQWRYGRPGVMAEFPFTQIPAVEFLCATADTAQTVLWDLVKIG